MLDKRWLDDRVLVVLGMGADEMTTDEILREIEPDVDDLNGGDIWFSLRRLSGQRLVIARQDKQRSGQPILYCLTGDGIDEVRYLTRRNKR